MTRVLVLLLVTGGSCLAQSVYAAPGDGSRLYFFSTNRLPGTGQSFRPKLFSWDPSGHVQLVYESPEWWLATLSITADGSLAAFSATCDCPAKARGLLLHTATGEVEEVGSQAVISRNGRYLFTGNALVDRLTGESRPTPAAAFVGSDGSVLYKDLSNLHRIEPDGTDRVVMGGLRFGLIADADENAETAVVVPGPTTPLVLNTRTGERVDLIELGAATGHPAYLSADGQQVFFAVYLPLHPGYQVMMCRSDATACRLLTTPPITAYPAAISGDGSTAYALYRDRLLRIDTATGRTEQPFVIPVFYPVQDVLVPGSLVRFTAWNAGRNATLNGEELPVLASAEESLIVQIPWEAAGEAQFTLWGGDSPFETSTRVYPLAGFHPQAFASPAAAPLENSAYRQDWSATTYESPALPGEIVHIYAVGLGEVDCPVETGRPAPLDRLCRITRTVNWQWTTGAGTVAAEVLFAGLAPGTIGAYQIDVRVPSGPGAEFIELSDGQVNPRVAIVRVVRP